ncbi:putative CRISPR-associated protein [uncultured Chloroflexus sp.]|uniref:putative CRISPR-associated protein n=1 Tax=uncultured Chloroflexus sp. TaxID=214040 RepID=UPI00260195E2|nr:putative CRISPR-associated protein [uncultured Chloroflexus sp.]
MSHKRLIVSTVGISVFLNILDPSEGAWRQQLNQAANAQQLSSDLAAFADELMLRAADRLQQGDVAERRRISAELNGIYGIYNNNLEAGKADTHCLIATDTALGRKAAEVIEDFLRECDLSVYVYVPEKLSTATPAAFSNGMKALICWCEETLPSRREEGYRVIFNLTAAFKSLQGYLSVMGMFYADEMVYIFEGSEQLVSIPRLPIQVDFAALRDHRVELAMMAEGHIFPCAQVATIPDSLLDIDEKGDACLSGWGQLIWSRVRHELLSKALLQFPRLHYDESFQRDFKQADQKERVKLQETLAKVAHLLEYHGGNTAALKQDGGLQYDIYTGKKTSDGRPIGHFRVNQGRRVSCTAKDGILYLRRYGEHSINDNP